MSERVLVVRREDLFAAAPRRWVGFEAGSSAVYLDVIGRRGEFVDRAGAETDAELKQIIPYCIVAAGDDVYLMRRTRRGEEARLHDRLTLGVGGHINPEDAAEAPSGAVGFDRGRAIVAAALRRELAEELVVKGPTELDVLGALNDDSNPVGEVHFGVVFRLRVESRDVSVREVDRLEGRFASWAEVCGQFDAMETWSRLVVESLDRDRATLRRS